MIAKVNLRSELPATVAHLMQTQGSINFLLNWLVHGDMENISYVLLVIKPVLEIDM